MSNQFNVVEAEFGSFEICAGFARLDWRYFAGDSKYKYCDGCSVRVNEKEALTLVYYMSTTALCCEKSGNGLDILYSSGIPVAYKTQTMDKWLPFTNNWHKRKLEEYLGGKCND